jgi:hypothetical protein
MLTLVIIKSEPSILQLLEIQEMEKGHLSQVFPTLYTNLQTNSYHITLTPLQHNQDHQTL